MLTFPENFNLEHLKARPPVYDMNTMSLGEECVRVTTFVKEMAYNGARFIEINVNRNLFLTDTQALLTELCVRFPGHVDILVKGEEGQGWRLLNDVSEQVDADTKFYRIRIE